jgi:hypothetical protein
MSKNDYYEIRNIIQESMGLRRFQRRIADKTSIDEADLKQV